MSQDQPRSEEWLKALLALNRNRPGFRDSLGALIGEAEEWADEGDVYFTSKRVGVEILTNANGDVAAVFLFGPESDDGSEYRGRLPGALKFRLTRDEVRSRLGEPKESGEPKVHLGNALAPWDKYRLPDYWLHARYTLDGSQIVRVTITPTAGSQGRDEKGP